MNRVLASTLMSVLLFFDMFVPALEVINIHRADQAVKELASSISSPYEANQNQTETDKEHSSYYDAMGVENGLDILRDYFDNAGEEPNTAVISIIGPGIEEDHEALQGRILPGKNFLSDRDDHDLSDELEY